MSRILLSALVACVLVAARGVDASADSVAFVAGGDVAMSEDVVAAARPWLTSHGWSLDERAFDRKASDALVSCFMADDKPCAKPIVARAHVDRVIVVTVEVQHDVRQNTDAVTLTGGLFGADGTALGGESRFCDRCRKESLVESTNSLLDALAKAAAVRSGESVLHVASEPSGARVLVDGQPVGVTPMDYNVTPGKHQISVDKPDYQVAGSEVTAVAGKSQTIDYSLAPAGRVATGHHRGRGVLPWLVGGGGVALLAGGGALIAINKPQASSGDRGLTYRPSLVPGVALAGAGAVAIGVSIYMFVRHRDDAAPGPQVGITADGVWFGYAGAF